MNSSGPHPPQAAWSLLNEAVRGLGAADPTKDNLPEFRQIVLMVDQLLTEAAVDPVLLPPGSEMRLRRARALLNAAPDDMENASRAYRELRQLQAEWGEGSEVGVRKWRERGHATDG